MVRFRTPICDLLGIEYPLLLAGMGGVSGPELVAAVSNAGGMGVLGAAAIPPQQLEEWITRTRKLTDRPFGVDTLLPASVPKNLQELSEVSDEDEVDPNSLIPPEVIEARDRFMEREGLQPINFGGGGRRRGGGFVKDFFQTQLEVILDLEVPLYVAGLGDPGQDFVKRAHGVGMKVMGVAGNARHAQKFAESGADAVIAQGTDGGGHNSPVGTMTLIPIVVDAVTPLPVIGAGGIVEGRGMAAALMLGAAGVWLGTVFLATDESMLPLLHKKAVLEAGETDTVVSKSVTGKPARMIRGKWSEFVDKGETKALPMPLQTAVAGPVLAAAIVQERSDVWSGFAGQGVALVNQIRPASQIVEEMILDAAKRLEGVKSIPGLEIQLG